MPFYKTLETLEQGPLSWNQEADIFGTRIEQLLNKPHMSPDLADDEITAVGGQTTQTLSFTAPEDLTIKRIVIYPVNRTSASTTLTVNDPSGFMALDRLELTSGTGPDVGVPLFEGSGAALMTPFGVRNLSFAPILNIRMAESDVLEMDVYSSIENYYIYSMIITYETGIDTTVSPKIILTSAAGILSGLVTTGTAASATLTVNAVTSASIEFQKHRAVIGDIGDLAKTLSGTPGGSSDQYNTSLGTRTLIRDDIYNVITSTHTDLSYWSDWTIGTSGSFDITFTRDDVGAAGNFDIFTPSSADITVTAFTGGTSLDTSLSMQPPSIDVVLKDIYACTLGGLDSPFPTSVHGMQLVGLDINSSPVAIGNGSLSPLINRPLRKIISESVSSGQTISLDFRASQALSIYTMIVAERA